MNGMMDEVKEIVSEIPRAEDRLEARLKELERIRGDMDTQIAKVYELMQETFKLIENLQTMISKLIALIEAEARQDVRDRIKRLEGYG